MSFSFKPSEKLNFLSPKKNLADKALATTQNLLSMLMHSITSMPKQERRSLTKSLQRLRRNKDKNSWVKLQMCWCLNLKATTWIRVPKTLKMNTTTVSQTMTSRVRYSEKSWSQEPTRYTALIVLANTPSTTVHKSHISKTTCRGFVIISPKKLLTKQEIVTTAQVVTSTNVATIVATSSTITDMIRTDVNITSQRSTQVGAAMCKSTRISNHPEIAETKEGTRDTRTEVGMTTDTTCSTTTSQTPGLETAITAGDRHEMYKTRNDEL